MSDASTFGRGVKFEDIGRVSGRRDDKHDVEARNAGKPDSEWTCRIIFPCGWFHPSARSL